MSTFAQVYQTKKPPLLLVLLFLVTLGFSEIPEDIRLINDVSNDFVVSACGRVSVQSASLREESAVNSTSGPVKAVPARIARGVRFPSAAEPLHLSGQDCLLLWSIQRI